MIDKPRPRGPNSPLKIILPFEHGRIVEDVSHCLAVHAMSLSSLSYWPHSSAVDLSIGNMASAVLHNGIPLHVFHINVDHVVDLLCRQPPTLGGHSRWSWRKEGRFRSTRRAEKIHSLS